MWMNIICSKRRTLIVEKWRLREMVVVCQYSAIIGLIDYIVHRERFTIRK